ncbi:MAG: GAF domain-containing protein [Anaerolineales bacterium]|nr:GAF domain-containing protein [Anaerolineales bacterium]
MRAVFRRWFAPPIFEADEEKTRIAGLLNSILLFIVVITALAIPFLLISAEPSDRIAVLILLVPFILIDVGALLLMRRGYVAAASSVFLFNLSLAIFGSYAVSAPESPGSLLAIMIVVAFTNVLLGARTVIRLVGFIVIFTFFVTIGRMQGWLTPVFAPAVDAMGNWLSSAIVFVLAGLGVYLSSISLRRALDNSNSARKVLQTTNRELADLQKALEDRVKARTADLEKRAIQLQAVSSAANAIATVQDMDALLPAITNLVSERFGFYHAGIFLLDDNNEYAVLRAANSEGGKRMLDRQHKLLLDTNSMVGFAVSLGQPRVTLDVGTDSVYFNNPDLPNTRAEMALPLRVGNRVIGALDVQSVQQNAFTQDDVEVLGILADQIAIAIENARLFSEAKAALAESRETVDKYIRQEWKSFSRQMRQNAFTFDGRQVAPLLTSGPSERTRHVAQTGRLSLEKSSANMAVPIKLRGQTIGILEVRPKKGQKNWTEDEIALLEAAADRAAFALENARLVESAQRRAARERTIGEIASKIGAVGERNLILQAAVEGLGRKIGNSEIIIEMDDRIEDASDAAGGRHVE